jgi:hypothetical protein
VVGLCRLFGVSKQAYYKTVNHVFERSMLKHFIIEYVRGVREQSPGTGGEKLWLMYQSFFGHSYSVGRDAFGESFCFLSLVTDAYIPAFCTRIILKAIAYRLV